MEIKTTQQVASLAGNGYSTPFNNKKWISQESMIKDLESMKERNCECKSCVTINATLDVIINKVRDGK
jgi:hypothetical protein